MNKLALVTFMLLSVDLFGQSKLSVNASSGFVSSSQQLVTPDGAILRFMPIIGISASVGVEYGLHRHWALAGNIQYLEKGAQIGGVNANNELRLRHISISPIAIFRHSTEKKRFQVGLGPSLSFLTGSSSALLPADSHFQKIQYGLQSHIQVTHSFDKFELGIRGQGYYDLNSAFDIPNNQTTTNLGWGISLVGIYNIESIKK